MLKQHTISFKNAFAGVAWALKTQPNYRIHFLLSVLSIFAGWFLHVSYSEFLVILTLIAVGLAIETINTAIEVTLDVIDTKWREDIKLAKDLAAAAMLFFSIGAAVIAGIIFLPKLALLISNF